VPPNGLLHSNNPFNRGTINFQISLIYSWSSEEESLDFFLEELFDFSEEEPLDCFLEELLGCPEELLLDGFLEESLDFSEEEPLDCFEEESFDCSLLFEFPVVDILFLFKRLINNYGTKVQLSILKRIT